MTRKTPSTYPPCIHLPFLKLGQTRREELMCLSEYNRIKSSSDKRRRADDTHRSICFGALGTFGLSSLGGWFPFMALEKYWSTA